MSAEEEVVAVEGEEEEQTTSKHDRKALTQLKALIKDAGVSQTTLEEVFIAATSE